MADLRSCAVQCVDRDRVCVDPESGTVTRLNGADPNGLRDGTPAGMMYSIMAFRSLGYEEDQPDLLEALRHFENLILETETRFQFQPAFSPICDTAICAYALGETEYVPDPAAMTKAADRLLSKEIRRKGDWAVKRPDLIPSGWAFEFANEYYPDIDDTAMVLIALRYAKATDPQAQA